MMRATPRTGVLPVLLALTIGVLTGRIALADDAEQQFSEFLQSPTKENFVAVYQAVTTGPKYDPYGDDLTVIKRLVAEKKYKQARKKLEAARPNLRLSPSAHQCAAEAARALGDEETAKKETQIAEKCLQGILASGDGSREHPYLVTRVSDEYDLMRHLNTWTNGQGLSIDGERSYDVHDLTDGSQLWFDITAVFGSMKRKGK